MTFETIKNITSFKMVLLFFAGIAILLNGRVSGQLAEEGKFLTNARVVGVQIVNFSDCANGICPFSLEQEYTFSILADLPIASATVRCTVKNILADNGDGLLDGSKFAREIRYPKLSKDNCSTIFLEEEMFTQQSGGKN